jgi:hypothetical protein
VDDVPPGTGGMLFGLFTLHRKQREREREKRVQYSSEPASASEPPIRPAMHWQHLSNLHTRAHILRQIMPQPTPLCRRRLKIPLPRTHRGGVFLMPTAQVVPAHRTTRRLVPAAAAVAAQCPASVLCSRGACSAGHNLCERRLRTRGR